MNKGDARMNTGTWLSLLKWFVDRLTWRLIAQLAVLTVLGGGRLFHLGVSRAAGHDGP